MGNAQSQTPPTHRIQKLPGKIAAKFPAVAPRGQAKDSGYRSGSASSSGTAIKGARANDATVVSTGSDQGSTSRPEATAPAAGGRHNNAPAPVTETVRRECTIYGSANRVLISFPSPLHLLSVPQSSFRDGRFFGSRPVSSEFRLLMAGNYYTKTGYLLVPNRENVGKWDVRYRQGSRPYQNRKILCL